MKFSLEYIVLNCILSDRYRYAFISGGIACFQAGAMMLTLSATRLRDTIAKQQWQIDKMLGIVWWQMVFNIKIP